MALQREAAIAGSLLLPTIWNLFAFLKTALILLLGRQKSKGASNVKTH